MKTASRTLRIRRRYEEDDDEDYIYEGDYTVAPG